MTTANKHDRYARCEKQGRVIVGGRNDYIDPWDGLTNIGTAANETAAWMDKYGVRSATETVKWGRDAIKVSTAVNGDTKIKARIKSKKQLKAYIKVLKAVADEQFGED